MKNKINKKIACFAKQLILCFINLPSSTSVFPSDFCFFVGGSSVSLLLLLLFEEAEEVVVVVVEEEEDPGGSGFPKASHVALAPHI